MLLTGGGFIRNVFRCIEVVGLCCRCGEFVGRVHFTRNIGVASLNLRAPSQLSSYQTSQFARLIRNFRKWEIYDVSVLWVSRV